MVMDMRNNEFVKAKQNAQVLSSYVQDRRTLKRKSHVSVTLNTAAIVEKPQNTQSMEGYLKLNLRNKSLFLEHSRKVLATAATKTVIDSIRNTLDADILKQIDAGKGVKVIAQVSKQEIVSVELWKE
jgi:hypothetical protein